MNHTAFGRYVYAVGGNETAARLSGVPVVGVLIAVYAICGLAAGLAGFSMFLILVRAVRKPVNFMNCR